MDSRSKMEARPPALIEAVVRLLVPPASREHVVGDLWERYRSPQQFVLDAVRTLPFVVASRIRRTSTVGLLFIQSFVLVIGISAGSRSLTRAVAPAIAALVFLVLRDAYRSGASVSWRQVARDVLVGLAGVLVSQAIVAIAAPDLLLPVPGAFIGVAVSFGMIFLLRLQNPGFGAASVRAIAEAPASLEALVAEVRVTERLTLRAVRIEMLAGVVLAGFFLTRVIGAENRILQIGWLLAASYGLYVAIVMFFKRPMPIADGLGYEDTLALYRARLEQQHAWTRRLWLWYLLPLAPGMTLIMAGATMVAASRGRPIWPGAAMIPIVLLVFVAVHFGSREQARRLRLRIDALKAAEGQ